MLVFIKGCLMGVILGFHQKMRLNWIEWDLTLRINVFGENIRGISWSYPLGPLYSMEPQ